MDRTSAAEERKVSVFRRPKGVVSRAGYNCTHFTSMALVAGDRSQIPPTLSFKENHVAHRRYERATIHLYLRGRCTGWLSAEIFADGIQDVFLREVTPSDHPLGKVLLVLDGGCTHYKPELLEMCKSKGVEILPRPPECTNILQPLGKAVFRNLKKELSRQSKRNSARQRRCQRVMHADFVHKSTEAWQPGVTTRNISSGFRAMGNFLFDCGSCSLQPHLSHRTRCMRSTRYFSAPTRVVEQAAQAGSQEQTL